MPDDDDIDIHAAFKRKERTNQRTGVVKRGNFRVDFTSDELVVNTSAKDICMQYADAMREQVSKQIAGVVEPVSRATYERRNRAIGDGKSRWYRRRYSGGRSQARAPGKSWRKINDSERLLHGLFVRLRESSSGQATATLNVPANRLDEATFGTPGQFQRYLTELKRLVPLLAGKGNARVASAMQDLLDGLLATSKARYRKLRADRARAILAAARAAGGLLG